jgi:hypothetical protein
MISDFLGDGPGVVLILSVLALLFVYLYGVLRTLVAVFTTGGTILELVRARSNAYSLRSVKDATMAKIRSTARHFTNDPCL